MKVGYSAEQTVDKRVAQTVDLMVAQKEHQMADSMALPMAAQMAGQKELPMAAHLVAHLADKWVAPSAQSTEPSSESTRER